MPSPMEGSSREGDLFTVKHELRNGRSALRRRDSVRREPRAAARSRYARSGEELALANGANMDVSRKRRRCFLYLLQLELNPERTSRFRRDVLRNHISVIGGCLAVNEDTKPNHRRNFVLVHRNIRPGSCCCLFGSS